jgi:hypothetical protein
MFTVASNTRRCWDWRLVIEARDRGTVDDFGVTGTAVCLRVIEHDVDGQPKRAGVL